LISAIVHTQTPTRQSRFHGMKKCKEKHPKTLVEIVKNILPTRARQSTIDQRPLVTITVPSTSASEEDLRGRRFSTIADRLVEDQQYASLRDLSSRRPSNSDNSLSEIEQTSVQQQNTTTKTRSLPDLSDILDNSEGPNQTIIQNQHSTPKAPHRQKLINNILDHNNLEESFSAESSERTANQEESEQMANQQPQIMNGESAQPNPNNSSNNIVRDNQIGTRMTDERMRIDPFSGDTNPTVSDFLKIYKYNGGRREMTDEQLVRNLVDYLKGEALMWFIETYDGKEKEVTFEELRRDMVNRFGSMSGINKARSELRNRYQQRDENVGVYVRDILKLCAKVDMNMSEENKIYQIMHNLLPSYQNMIVAHEAKTTDELLSRLRAIENNLDIMPLASSSSSKPLMGHNSSSSEAGLMKEMSEMKQAIQQIMTSQRNQQRSFVPTNRFMQSGHNYLQRNPRNWHQQAPQPSYQPPRGETLPDGRPICDYCGMAGHLMRSCRRYIRNSTQGNEYQNTALRQIDWQGESRTDQPRKE
jgi:Ty3 transposon capsid-like protein